MLIKKHTMTIEDIIDELGEPLDSYDRIQSNKANKDSYFLFEYYELYPSWDTKIWIFNDLKEFYDYAYSHVMFDYINRGESDWYDFDVETDQSELYEQLLTLKNRIWTEEECHKFVATFDHPLFELVQFGKIDEFFNASKEDLDKCSKIFISQEQIKALGIKEGFYHTVSEFKRLKNKFPSEDKEAFLEFVS